MDLSTQNCHSFGKTCSAQWPCTTSLSHCTTHEIEPTFSPPCNHAPPVVGHEGAGGVAEGWDQLHYVLPQEVNLVVLLVGGTLRITIAP